MFNKMLVIVFINDFYSGYGPGFQKPSLSISAHFYHSVLEMGQVLVLELMPSVTRAHQQPMEILICNNSVLFYSFSDQ